mmetsp:Transcript_26807/g.37794  ORF Transcript_26807/g.37794 Transcript_26807/m.37794 type:complete len:325 (-) Transcript_26807:43-1017(-)
MMRGILLLFSLVQYTLAFGFDDPNAQSKVLVTGAGGRTGKLVFNLLIKEPKFYPTALVRTESSAKQLIKSSHCGLEQVVVCDVTQLNVDAENGLPEGLDNTDSMIICTSAVPFLSKKSLIQAVLKVPLNILRKKKALDFRTLRFKFKKGQYPEKVDYEGQKAQIDLAKKLGIKHVVIVSSMGGTDPSNFLNSVGKKPDGTGNGDILLWKRKAEKYLVDSGINYSIIHPGGLIDTPPSLEDFVLDVDDVLLESKKKSICRADVAALCLASLTVGKGKNVSFDCITKPPEEGETARTAEEALAAFLEEEKTTDYSLQKGKRTDMSI